MATVLDCARLCDAVYETNPAAAGWTRIGFHEAGYLPQSAFQGAAFQKAGTVVFAFKGTSVASRSAVGDVLADLKLGVGMNTVQFDLAGQFVEETLVPDGHRVLLTGHSLGGAIAQIVGTFDDVSAVPEPSAGALLASGLLGLGALSRLSRRAA